MVIGKNLIDTLDVEQNIISCILQKPKLIYDISSKIDKDFFQKKENRNHNRSLYRILKYLSKEKDMQNLEYDPMTIISIAKKFKDVQHILKDVFSSSKDFVKYIKTLRDLPIKPKNWDYHVDELIKINLVNDIINNNERFNHKIKDNYAEMNIEEIVNEAESGILKYSNKYSGNKDNEPVKFGENIVDEYANREYNPNKFVGLPTPFKTLNTFTKGILRSGAVTVINAHSGVGKSIFLKNVAKYIGIDLGEPVYLGANEMTVQEQKDRIASEITGYSTGILENGYYNCPHESFTYNGKEYNTERVRKDVLDALNKVEDAPIYIDQIQGYNQEKLVQKAKYFHTRHNIKAFIWDYVKESAGLPNIELRHALAKIVTSMKENIADPLGIPVLTAAQAKPNKFWLSAESYGIEKFSTGFIILRQLTPKERNENPMQGKYALTVKKNRYSGGEHDNYNQEWISMDLDKSEVRFKEVV